MAVFAAHFEFSLAELLIGIFAACIAGYILVTLVLLIVRPGGCAGYTRWCCVCSQRASRFTRCSASLWGTYYYGDSFLDASGL